MVPLRVTEAATRDRCCPGPQRIMAFEPCTADDPVDGLTEGDVMFPVRLTPVAPLLGVRAVTVGAVVSAAAAVVKVQVRGRQRVVGRVANGRVPPVSVAVYWVFGVRFAVGFRVATRVLGVVAHRRRDVRGRPGVPAGA